MIATLARPFTLLVDEAGLLASTALEGYRNSWRVTQWWDEFVEQAWFLVTVTSVPVFLIAIPLGATIALQVGDVARQLGAQSVTGGVLVVGIIREASPLATAVLIAGAGGSAMAADMGARNIRSELDAMEVMGVNPIHRLVTPRIWAASVVTTFLVSLVIVSGVLGGFVFNVLFQGVSPGAYFGNATLLLQLPDLVQALVKAWIFGAIAAIVSCAKGMTSAKGPIGVGRAVNRAVVETFVLVMGVNYVLSTLYFMLFPPQI